MFKTQMHLKTHQMAIHCSTCEKAFKTKHSLQAHQVVHLLRNRTNAPSAGRASGTPSRCSAIRAFTLGSIPSNARCVAKLL
ncbi:hypothetical protein F7725_020404 [Dissostichus mawsoni]|uniref:C2H2-type domain-containing protein n=1 Tax=Dissostichus mawsoni TaxID=36200 RepID=A0A7J5YD40_DISMA|nr:hypothetical protein F7725_020404 [Dissostichus mawsoni]